MPGKYAIKYYGAFALALAANSAGALPFNSFDPRSFAMGGVGVASGTGANAVFFNPALLAAAREEEDFSLELPVLGARVSDPDDLIDAVDDFNDQDPVAVFSAAIDAYTAAPSGATADAVQASGDELVAQLRSLSDKPVMAEGGVGIVVGVPSESLGISLFSNAYVGGGSIGSVAGPDISAIQGAIDDALALQPVTDPTDSLMSSVEARFVVLFETGVALARRFDALGGIAVGITPKYVKAMTYDYRFTGKEIDGAEIDLDQGEQSDADFNIDLGVAKDYGNGWKAGLAVRNALSKEYTTVLNHKLKVEPAARLGVSRQSEWITVAADVDLTENEPAGFETKTQYAAVGVELDVFDTAQLRVGYRHNLSDVPSGTESGMFAAGAGFSPFGIHVDLAVAGNTDEIGGAMQLGFRF